MCFADPSSSQIRPKTMTPGFVSPPWAIGTIPLTMLRMPCSWRRPLSHAAAGRAAANTGTTAEQSGYTRTSAC